MKSKAKWIIIGDARRDECGLHEATRRPHQWIYGGGCTGSGGQERTAEGGQDKANGCQSNSRVAFSLHHQCSVCATLATSNYVLVKLVQLVQLVLLEG